MEKSKSRKRILEGVVVSDKMDKTAVILVKRNVRHPIYEKLIERRKKYYAHDEKNSVVVGQKVKIIESKPTSKLKRWSII
jgi:small subunit ribosomal protein S17